MNGITFIKGQGGLNRIPTNNDYISGFIFFDSTKPSGFTTPYVKKLLSIVDAETYGIKKDYSDETKASATFQVTNKGASGDTMELFVTDFTGILSLGVYLNGTNAGVNDAATAIAAFINAGTYSHGYTATALTDTVTIKPPAGKGVALNSGTPLTKTIVGTLAGTITQFSGGVASKLVQYWYQINEYFRMMPNGQLWVMIADVPVGTYTWAEINTLLNAAAGEIRQFAIFANTKTSVSTTDLSAIQAVVVAADVTYAPSSCLYSCDITALGTSSTALASLPDLSSLLDNKVSVIIEQSMSGYGYALYKTTGKSVPGLGTALGTLSSSNVADDIGEVGKYNISDGVEHETAGFANGQYLTDITPSLLASTDGFRYIFGTKFNNYTGTFWNDDHCAISKTSDYAYIDDNRVIDKAIRITRLALIPKLKSKLKLNSDGTLADYTVAGLEGAVREKLNQMVKDDELSALTVFVDPAQNVLSTSQVAVSVSLLKQGIMRNIVVTIGYKTSL